MVWESYDQIQRDDIFGQRYNVSGNAVGGEFLVNTATGLSQEQPRVGHAADGRFVVGWMGRTDFGAYDISARRFDALGNPIGSDFVANTYTAGDQYFGDLAVEANGNFVVVWVDKTTTTPSPPVMAPATASSASATTPRATGWGASSR